MSKEKGTVSGGRLKINGLAFAKDRKVWQVVTETEGGRWHHPPSHTGNTIGESGSEGYNKDRVSL